MRALGRTATHDPNVWCGRALQEVFRRSVGFPRLVFAPTQVRNRLAAGGRWIRTFGPSVQTMLLDTADPLAGRAGRSLRETAPRWDFGYTFVAILMAIACAFFPGMP
jgi:hypothetical protein